ncbi:MAG: ABC-2 type transport system permease protein [Clostridium sp.]|jgi:ABC-2 type transport system permease protein
MLNLIIKEIAIQKKTLLYTFLYTVFTPFAFFSMGQSDFSLYVISPLGITYMFTTFAASYDDKNKSEIVLNSLPLKRSDIVISKYISTLLYAFIGFIYSILIGSIGKATGLPMFTRSISLLDIVFVLTSVCIFAALFFPAYFKFGFMKTKVFDTLLLMLIVVLPSLAIQYAGSSPNNVIVQKINYLITNTSSFTQNTLALTIGLIFFLISLMFSMHIYNNKEF